MNRLIVQFSDIESLAFHLKNTSAMWKGFEHLLRRCPHQGKFAVSWTCYTSIRVVDLSDQINVIDIPHRKFTYHPSDLPENIKIMTEKSMAQAGVDHILTMNHLSKLLGEELGFTSAVLNIGDIDPLWASREFLEGMGDDE